MTRNERSALVDFVRDRNEHLEAASVIHQCWPEIKEQVVRAFYGALWRAEGDYVDNELWVSDWDETMTEKSSPDWLR